MMCKLSGEGDGLYAHLFQSSFRLRTLIILHSQFSDNLTYWRNPASTYPVPFQNHRASFVLSGSAIHINGHGTGGIDGNGETWYHDEKAHTQPGRPMPFVLWNITKSSVKSFYVKNPPLWGVNVMGGQDLVLEDLIVNATAGKSPWGKNWVQNTDGFGG
jgi:galacturan 1,4-alpha-galacturonidase